MDLTLNNLRSLICHKTQTTSHQGTRLKSTYLASTLCKSIIMDDKVKTKLTKASAAFGRPNRNVWNQRHLRGNHNQFILSCRSYHPPLWLWNMDYLSTAYKDAKTLSLNLSEEDSWHHMAKTHPWPWSFNSGFSTQYLHHLDAITTLLGLSCCLHERSLPPKKTALQWTILGQALTRRLEKALQKNWRSSWNLLVSPQIVVAIEKGAFWSSSTMVANNYV